MGNLWALASLLQIVRQHGAHTPPRHQNEEQAALVGQECKPESYYFPPQHNHGNHFHTFFGLEPGTTKDQVRKCLSDWNKGDNGILIFPRPTGSNSAPAGWSVLAFFMPLARFALMSPNGEVMSMRYVSESCGGPFHTLESAGQGHASGEAP